MKPATRASNPPAPAARPHASFLRRFSSQPILRIVLFALALRVFTAFLALLVNVVFPLQQREPFTVTGRTHMLWDTFARYDSGWYNGIARNGYRYVPGGRSNLAFFPVYPLAMRYLAQLLGGRQADYYYAGILVSWVSFAAAMVLLHKLARLDVPEPAADRAVVYAAIFPFAFFFGVVYSESLFLLLTLACVYSLRTRRWPAAGVAGALASATRVNGILALPAFAWIGWRAAAGDRKRVAAALAAVVFTASGFVAYSVYVYWVSGSYFEWANSIRRWGYSPGAAPWTSLAALLRALATRPYSYLTGEPAAPYDVLNGGAALIVAASIPFVWMRLGTGYGVFLLANLWLPLSSGQFEGLGRYCAVAFPFFIWLATLKPEGLHTALIIVSACLYTVCLALFTTIHPIF